MPQMPSVEEDEKVPYDKAFWISDKQIYLEQFYFNSGRFQCRLFDIEDQRWTTPPHCFRLQRFGSSPGRVYGLGNDLYAGIGSNEGWASVRIVKWTPETGSLETDFPETSLGLSAASKIYSENEGSRIYLLTPLTFQGHLPQGDLMADYTSRDKILYRWTKDKGFEKTGIVLPARIALRSVKSKITAWVDDDEEKICLGHLEREVICRKFPVPIPAP